VVQLIVSDGDGDGGVALGAAPAGWHFPLCE